MPPVRSTTSRYVPRGKPPPAGFQSASVMVRRQRPRRLAGTGAGAGVDAAAARVAVGAGERLAFAAAVFSSPDPQPSRATIPASAVAAMPVRIGWDVMRARSGAGLFLPEGPRQARGPPAAATAAPPTRRPQACPLRRPSPRAV